MDMVYIKKMDENEFIKDIGEMMNKMIIEQKNGMMKVYFMENIRNK